MPLIVDLFARYNTVSDWNALASHVDGAYIKYSDGSGSASTPADDYVAHCRDHKIAYGGYHFAEPGIAVAQADVFVHQYQRLGGQLAPALDLESGDIPVSDRPAFARAFLERVHQTYPVVVLYASTSWLSMLNPDTWPYLWDRTWAAQYGPNDGARHPITGYRGRVDLHQYTSTGRIAGVSGDVDLSWTDNLAALRIGSTATEDDLQPDEREALFRLYEQLCGEGAVPEDPNMRYPGWDTVLGKKTVVDMLRDLVATLRGFQPSRITGDTNQTNMMDLAFDGAQWTFEDKAALTELRDKLDQVITHLGAQ